MNKKNKEKIKKIKENIIDTDLYIPIIIFIIVMIYMIISIEEIEKNIQISKIQQEENQAYIKVKEVNIDGEEYYIVYETITELMYYYQDGNRISGDYIIPIYKKDGTIMTYEEYINGASQD